MSERCEGRPRLFIPADSLRSSIRLLRYCVGPLATPWGFSVHVHQRLPRSSLAGSGVFWRSCSLSLSVVMSPELRASAVALRYSANLAGDLLRGWRHGNLLRSYPGGSHQNFDALTVGRTGGNNSRISNRIPWQPGMADQLVPLPDKPPAGQQLFSSLHRDSSILGGLGPIRPRRQHGLGPAVSFKIAETTVDVC